MAKARFQIPDILFGSVVADPPWPYEPENKVEYARTHRGYFDRMSLKEICAMPVGEHVHRDGHLWLWTTNPGMEMALDVVSSWGFKYKTMATWRKSKMGIGHWLRSRTEHLILAARTKRLRTSPGSWTTEIKGKWRGYAIKPPIFDRVEALSPGPYLELFCRDKAERPGWVRLGDDSKPSELYLQRNIYKPGTPNAEDANDGIVRGVGGLEIVPEAEYFYLEKTIHPLRAVVVRQGGRRVTIDVMNGGDAPERKNVSVDNLRGLDWAPEKNRTGQRRVIWSELA